MKNILLMLLVLLLTAGCKRKQGTDTPSHTTDKVTVTAFEAYKEQFVEDLWRTFPGWATGVGYHK